MTHTLPDLRFDYGALEPHIDAKTMEIHHSKHHNAYVTKLNEAESAFHDAQSRNDVGTLVKLTGAINFNGGGHANHTLFWDIMGPDGGDKPTGELAAAIDDAFGTFDGFRKHFAAQSAGVQGSGWGWLCFDPVAKRAVVTTTLAQDHPTKFGLVPVLGLDVWEHAYYLNYQNRRPDYIDAWWNVVDWDRVSSRFDKAKG